MAVSKPFNTLRQQTHSCLSRRSTAFALLLTLASLAGSMRAASLYQDGAGARAMALGGAGAAVANDPLSALFDNPAALTELDRPSVQLGIQGGFAQGEFHNRANRGDGDDDSLDAVGAIGSFAVSVPFGPLRFALGVNPDIAASADWRYRDTPGGADGLTTYGVRRHDAEILLLRSALGAAWQVTPTFSLGANVGLLYNRNRLNAPYIFQTQRVLRTVKTRLDLETDGLGWNGQFGARWKAWHELILSLSYETRATIRTDGRATGHAGVQLANLGLGAARPDFAYDATVTNVFPQQINAGLAWQPPAAKGLTIAAQFDWINWSDAFDVLPVRLRKGNNADLNGLTGTRRLEDDIPLHWRDQYVGRLGVEQTLGEHWSLRAGYSYGNNPIPSGTLSPLTAAITEHTLTAGAGYQTGRWHVDAAVQWQLPATGRTHRSDLAGGEYSDSSTEVTVEWIGVTTRLDF